jgi:hypothetical protein
LFRLVSLPLASLEFVFASFSRRFASFRIFFLKRKRDTLIGTEGLAAFFQRNLHLRIFSIFKKFSFSLLPERENFSLLQILIYLAGSGCCENPNIKNLGEEKFLKIEKKNIFRGIRLQQDEQLLA